MNNILIRRAIESDMPMIKKLAIELIESMANRQGISEDVVLNNCEHLIKSPNSYILLAVVNGKAIGLINFTIRKTILHPGLSSLVDELVVLRSYRRKGVGKELIHATIEECKKLGCCEVEVNTEFTNTNGREFYKGCGFEERGVILENDLV